MNDILWANNNSLAKRFVIMIVRLSELVLTLRCLFIGGVDLHRTSKTDIIITSTNKRNIND